MEAKDLGILELTIFWKQPKLTVDSRTEGKVTKDKLINKKTNMWVPWLFPAKTKLSNNLSKFIRLGHLLHIQLF